MISLQKITRRQGFMATLAAFTAWAIPRRKETLQDLLDYVCKYSNPVQSLTGHPETERFNAVCKRVRELMREKFRAVISTTYPDDLYVCILDMCDTIRFYPLRGKSIVCHGIGYWSGFKEIPDIIPYARDLS